MECEIINFSEKDKWREIVENKEIYYQWEYADAFFKNGDGEPFLIYAKDKHNYVYNVYLKRDIADDKNFKCKIEKNKYFDIITPYGYGGVEIGGEKEDKLLQYFFHEFDKYCINNNIISEFVRLNPLSNNNEFYINTNYQIDSISKTVYIKLEDEEQIWNDMESKCRNKIRKAKKNGVIVKSGFNKKMYNEFIELYKETMNRDNAIDYYYFTTKFFDSIYTQMNNNATIYTAYFEDKAINSLIAIYSGENAHYHLSGSRTECMNLGANNLSLYEAAVDLCNKGYKKFHLGGGYGGDDSPLLKFKKAFNKKSELLDFYIGKKIFQPEKYQELLEIRKQEKKFRIDSNFFPKYRA